MSIENGQVFVLSSSGEKTRAEAVFSQTGYERASGRDKILSSIPNFAVLAPDVPSYLASEFDVVLVVDTNTKPIGSDLVSVSCALECYPRKISSSKVEIQYRKLGNAAFRNCRINEAERFAWLKWITVYASGPRYRENQKIALVTDHDIANHWKYNTRGCPIYQDFYLPGNFILLYASGDAGRESVLNKLISQCDKDAHDMLEQLQENGCIRTGDSIVELRSIPVVAK